MEESSLQTRNKKLKDRLGLMVKVDVSNLHEEMAQNSSRMFLIGCLKADAERLKDRAENKVKIIEAKADKKIRSQANDGRKPSEDQIKKRIARNVEVIRAQDDAIEAKHRFNICWAAASSIAQKGDQLTNLAYNYRKELEHGVRSTVKGANQSARRLAKKGKRTNG